MTTQDNNQKKNQILEKLIANLNNRIMMVQLTRRLFCLQLRMHIIKSWLSNSEQVISFNESYIKV